MHNPEVEKHPPECRLYHGCYHWEQVGKEAAWRKLVDQHPFNAKISLLMPDLPSVPADLRELLTQDTQFYRIDKLPLHQLCAPAFLQAFLNKGQVFGLSCDTLLDTDNSAVIAPDGLLRLLLNKFTYQELALSGSLSADILRTPMEKFVVEVDLKNPNFYPGKPRYQQVKNAFTQLPLAFSFWILWVPNDPDVCPSSIAKYFHDLGYSVSECAATLSQNVLEKAFMPFPGPPVEEAGLDEQIAEPEDLLEWIGCQTLGIRLSQKESVLSGVVEPRHGTPVNNLCCAQSSGFFSPSLIHLVIQYTRSWLAQREATAVPWVSLTVYGHPDSAMSWRWEKPSCSSWDNLYTLVITREHLLAFMLLGPGKPQRLIVKTNKNK
ncbi:ribonuclease P protein subunit p40-like isoform X1 [Portunus trituberculatus]|uniref:ribonuclease P protein subunit p40-like isoform X1 n=1 Tax=Portunus trituberculatus TaxID=210409 RepID=UPI001E1CEC3D|nr:ribonuclease P protein subunit p40-like isoform X1 [Portunus trituberculatus]XP_045118628.1 ribonuclease P protein subunit p40-like isoform X1 [Portunus trituberculatus]